MLKKILQQEVEPHIEAIVPTSIESVEPQKLTETEPSATTPQDQAVAIPEPPKEPEPDPNAIPGIDEAEMELVAFNIEFADHKVLEKLVVWAYKKVVIEKMTNDDKLRAIDLPE